MSIIQDIRDKYARISVIAIALALIGFILTDYVRGKDRGRSGGRSNSIGSVNGHSVSIEEFGKTVDQSEAQMKQQGYPEAYAKQQAIDQAWTQHVNRIILSEEFDRLGMRIGKRERGDILYGPNAPEDIKKAGTDENTGQYDPMRAKQQVDQMMKNKQVPQAQKDQFNDYINQLELQRKSEKYAAFFTNSTNYPRWFVEKQTADNSLLGKISMVKVFYTDSVFVDSTIKISDKEIGDYLGKHKEDYKQEESRSINYVAFSAAPTAGDSAAIKNQVALLRAEFDTTNDVPTFLARNGSPELQNVYNTPSTLPAIAKDSILKLSKNGVYGTYLDGNSYILAKLIEIRMLPDSVKCRHILVSTDTKAGGFEDSIAAKKIDSIKNAVNSGASWADMVQKYNPLSDGSRAKNGEMTFPSSQIMEGMESGNFAKEFGQFVLFDGKPGEKKVVKTSFGWHYIEILAFIKPEPHYKLAYLKQEIVASQQTDGDALQDATNFAGDGRDQKSFDTAFEKTLKPKGLNKGIAANIKRNDAMVQGLGFSRNFVRNIYTAKTGETLKPERVGDNYVVAIVTEVLKEGTMPTAKARPLIEPILRNRKKAETLKQKAGKISSLEAVAAAWGKPIETVDSLRMKTGSTSAKFGNEPKVNGATFNPDNKGKVVPEALEGSNGVYAIRVEAVTATSAATGSVADQRKKMYDDSKQTGNNLIEALKKAASIKDKRAETY
ncbi:MAG TPA: peptidylprolyl isomerase [Chitinophagaceae bacterium]|nr:peptidylprolyl isomerase [Chitinophagaceae bacterium]